MGRLMRLGGSVLVLGASLLLSTQPARAESVLWTLIATPLTVTTGVPTTFTLTATNEDPLAVALSSSEIGCVVVTVPGSFSVSGAAVTGSNAGGSWTATVSGNQVKVRAGSGGDRLEFLQWVRFTVASTATSAGSLTWPARAFRQQDCSGGGALLGVPPIVLVVGPAVTPTPLPTATPAPTPTATPAPTPTATPRPTPTPLVPLPTLPLPSLPLPSLPLPTFGVPSPTAGVPSPSAGVPSPTAGVPGTSPSPDAGAPSSSSSASPGSSPGAGSSADPTPGATDDGVISPPGAGPGTPPRSPNVGATPAVAFDRADLDLGLGSIGILDGLDVWAVPAATIAGPGLAVLLWIAAQSLGAAMWVPAARRLRTGAARRARDRRPS